VTETLTPAVGYLGGKRRLLPRLREFFPPSLGEYAEPFVGMGALYLDLRARGFRGRAVLADANPAVLAFWAAVHSESAGRKLLSACDSIAKCEVSRETFFLMKGEDPSDEADLVARFLWMTNFAFANDPPWYRGEGCGWKTNGTKIPNASKWGKRFPWIGCVERIRLIAQRLKGMPVELLSDADDVLDGCASGVAAYCDPPYGGTWAYAPPGRAPGFLGPITRCKASTLVLSEASDLREALGGGWDALEGSTTARTSRNERLGSRSEWIYVRRST
jgi:DNA adenine methylase